MKKLALMGAALMLWACSKNDDPLGDNPSTNSTIEPIATTATPNPDEYSPTGLGNATDLTAVSDCYSNRFNIKHLSGHATVRQIDNVWYLKVGAHALYKPCKLPAAFKKEGRLVEFSGTVKNLLSNDFFQGKPLAIKEISSHHLQ